MLRRLTLRAVALSTRFSPKSAIKVHALRDIPHHQFPPLARVRGFEGVKAAKEGKRRNEDVREARIALTKGVARDAAVLVNEGDEDCIKRQLDLEKRKREASGDVHCTTLSTSTRSNESCIIRIWRAERVGWMCASWPGCAPNAPAG